MALAQPQTKADWLITLQGIKAFALTFTGIDDQSPTSDYSDGFHRRTYSRVGSPQMQPIVLTFGDDPRANGELVDYWKNFGGNVRVGEGSTLTAQSVEYENGEPANVGTPFVLLDFRPTRYQSGDADKTSADTSVITLTGVCSNWTKN